MDRNYIETIPENAFHPVRDSLTELDLSSNNIDVSVENIDDMFEEFKILSKLHTLDIAGNIFTRPEYKVIIF